MRRAKAYTKGGTGGGQLTNIVMISERPAEVDDRAVPGHWEGDLIFGRRMTAIGTLVERYSRYIILLKLPNGIGAEAVRTAMTKRILTLPAQLRRSITWDQGKEMAQHVQFTVDTGVQIYSVIRSALGSAGATRTPKDCSVSTCQSRRTSPSAHSGNSMPLHDPSIRDLDRPWLDDTIKGVRRCRCVDRLRPQHFWDTLDHTPQAGSP